MNGLSLFSGIGGIDVALSDWVKTKAYCEIDPFCQSVLLSRMQEGLLSKAPVWDDIRTLPYEQLPKIEIIFGGFPCQDISIAGRGKGLEGERSGLFFEIVRIAQKIRPKFIFLENVPAITSRGGTRVVSEIAKMGYGCRWLVISASSVGALHRRERWFLLAYTEHNGASSSARGGSSRQVNEEGRNEQKKDCGEVKRTSSLSSNVANPKSQQGGGSQLKKFQSNTLSSKNVAHTKSEGFEGQRQESKRDEKTQPLSSSVGDQRRSSRLYRPFESREHWQKIVSEMGKCSHGLPNHVARLKALGNSVVPQQVKAAFITLSGLD